MNTVSRVSVTRHSRVYPIAIALAILVSCVVVFGEVALRWNRPGFDFRQRLNESICSISEGVDPYLVYSGEIEHAKYYPYRNSPSEGRTEPVNGYTPWTYTFLFPLTKLPRLWAWRLGLCIGIVALASFFAWGCRRASRAGFNAVDAAFCGGAALFLGMSPARCIHSGNLDALVTPAIFLCGVCLQRKIDGLAGVFLALAMSKPQSALLFCIPLLFGKKWKTLAVGAIVDVLATFVPASACGISPLTLILDIPKFSADMAATGGLLVPRELYPVLQQWFSPMEITYFGMVVGAGLCAWLSWRARREEDWFLKFIPPAVWSVAWTYCTNRCVYFIPQFFFALSFVKAKTKKEKMVALTGMALLACYGLMYLHAESTDTFFSLVGLNVLGGRSGQALYGSYMLLSFAATVLTSVWFLGMVSRGRNRRIAVRKRRGLQCALPGPMEGESVDADFSV